MKISIKKLKVRRNEDFRVAAIRYFRKCIRELKAELRNEKIAAKKLKDISAMLPKFEEGNV